MPRFIIGVLTAEKYGVRQKAVRNTWGADAAAHPDADLVFLIGKPTLPSPQRDGDVLLLPCPDDYDSLPQKTRWFCRWALEQPGWDYLFKCDDDTYVQVDRLVSYSEWPTEIVGGYHTDDYHFHGGAGYTIKRSAATAIAKHLTARTGLEDWKARDAIHAAGLDFSLDNRFCWNKDRMPLPRNNIITCHYAAPIRMRLIYDDFRRSDSTDTDVAIPKILHQIWIGGEMPAHFRSYQDAWRRLHPEWELREHHDKDLAWVANRELFDAAPTPAQKSHIARYEILHRYGGVYVDTDVDCRRNIEPLLRGTIGLAAAEDDDAAGVAVLGCCPGDLLMKDCIDRLSGSCQFKGNCPEESGSRFFTRHLLEDRQWQLHWWNKFYPRHWNGDAVAPEADAFAVHHWTASWRRGR